LRISLDLHHMQIGELHVADHPGRCAPGTDKINDHGVAQPLTRMMYSRPVGLESFAAGDADAALMAFRNVFEV
jgi:hydroxypyruvate isomerase